LILQFEGDIFGEINIKLSIPLRNLRIPAWQAGGQAGIVEYPFLNSG
jgi:hypothetical protein